MMTAILVPSEIHFSYDLGIEERTEVKLYKTAPPPGIEKVAPVLPKLQVFRKEGCYFALDNNCLKLYRALEKRGDFKQVEVEIVSKNRIPAVVFQQTCCCEASSSSSGSNPPDMSDSDSSEVEDADLICLACGQSFSGIKELIKHQQDKKHFACCSCSSVFTSNKQLEAHKTLAGHGSDDDEDHTLGNGADDEILGCSKNIGGT